MPFRPLFFIWFQLLQIPIVSLLEIPWYHFYRSLVLTPTKDLTPKDMTPTDPSFWQLLIPSTNCYKSLGMTYTLSMVKTWTALFQAFLSCFYCYGYIVSQLQINFWVLMIHCFDCYIIFTADGITWRLYDRPGPEGRVGENTLFWLLDIHWRTESLCLLTVTDILFSLLQIYFSIRPSLQAW